MAKSNELQKIKKIYGEEFIHLCRELFPTILEEGLLLTILQDFFDGNCKTLNEYVINQDMKYEFKAFIEKE